MTENQTYQYLRNIINKKQLTSVQRNVPTNIIHQALKLMVNGEYQSHLKIIRDFFKLMNEQRQWNINIDHTIKHIQTIQFMVCQENQIYNLGNQKRGYCIVGKTLSLAKKYNVNLTTQQQQIRLEFITEIQSTITRLFYNNVYPLTKITKNYSLADLLFQFYLPNDNFLPAYLGNQVFNTFLSVSPSIILVIPDKNYKSPNIDILKGTLLRVFSHHIQLLDRLFIREPIYRNGKIQGVCFIQEGEVQVNSGRIVARGWANKGICKNSGYVWKFKPLNFFKFLATNENIWKQYLGDIKNNNEYPLNVLHILSLSQENSLKFNKIGSSRVNKNTKLPKLNPSSTQNIDNRMFVEIQKLRHYDERIQDIFFYKQDLLSRKLKGKILNQFQPWIESTQNIKKDARIDRMKRYLSSNHPNSKQIRKSHNSKQIRKSHESTENVLIVSVLRRLQSMASEEQERQEQAKFRLDNLKQKKLPLQLYEYSRKNRPHRRYLDK